MHTDEGYIIEFVRHGAYVKVSALDPRTLTEAVIVGSPAAGEEALTRVALRKLDYLMRKKTAR